MYSSMHIQDELGGPEEVPYIIEGLEAILGSANAVKERKIYSVVYCTLAPLVHEGHMCDAYLDLIQPPAYLPVSASAFGTVST